jgi:hypothetical protein
MWFVIIPIAILALFFIVLFVDSHFMGGRYLNRSNLTDSQFKKSLEAVLSQADRPIEAWDPIPQDWINDKMNISLKNPRLDAIRLSVVKAIGDGNTFKKLTPEAKSLIQEAIGKLK